MAGAVYLADTSAYVVQFRDTAARQRFQTLFLEGRLAICQMTALEYLNNAPDPGRYEALWGATQNQRWIDVTTGAMDRALEVHRALAARSQHRHFRLPDLIIAAAAELAGATVLHYDEDYERIAKITGQPIEWIVPKGSI
jgi:predicted nucleic acid-binding protein